MRTISHIWRLFIVSFVAMLTLVGTAHAQVEITYESEGKRLFSVEAPDNWHVTTGSNFNPDPKAPEQFQSIVRVVGMLPEGNASVWVGLFSPEGVQNIAEGEDYIRELDDRIVSNAKLKTKAEIRVGGRKARAYHGTGKRGQRLVDFSITLIDLPNNRIAIAVMLGEQGERSNYETQLKQIADSFRVRN